MRNRREFTAQEIEQVTSLWNAGEPAEEICRLAGISKSTLDYHRHCGVFVHLPKRIKGSGKKGNRRDDEETGMLFGLSREEWTARRDAIRNGWSLDEQYERSKGIEEQAMRGHAKHHAAA